MNTPQLFVLLDKNGKLITGGGSSTKAFIRTYDNKNSARRGARYFRGSRIVEYGYVAEVEE